MGKGRPRFDMGMIGSAKNVSSTMGDAGSFLLGGGIGARRADINTEKNRRKNVLESNVVNAKGKQIENLRTLMQSEHLSDDDKAKHSSTIERLLAENQASLDKIKSRSEKMSGDMAKSQRRNRQSVGLFEQPEKCEASHSGTGRCGS